MPQLPKKNVQSLYTSFENIRFQIDDKRRFSLQLYTISRIILGHYSCEFRSIDALGDCVESSAEMPVHVITKRGSCYLKKRASVQVCLDLFELGKPIQTRLIYTQVMYAHCKLPGSYNMLMMELESLKGIRPFRITEMRKVEERAFVRISRQSHFSRNFQFKFKMERQMELDSTRI